MKTINKIFNIITMYLVFAGFMAFCSTFLFDYLDSISWFGDYERTFYSDWRGRMVTETVWGSRHYIYNWLTVILFMAGTARCIFSIINVIEKQNGKSN